MQFSDLKLGVISWLRWRRYKQDLPLFTELLNPQMEDVILDVGAGTGVIASSVAKQCDDVFALDPVDERISFIKTKFPEVKAFQGSAENIQFPQSYFTKIYVINAFHHFENQEAAVSEFYRILKPSGLLLIQEMSRESSVAKLEQHHSHPHFKTPEDLEEMLSEAGFHLKRLEKTKQGYFLLCDKTLSPGV